jgi:hypothetical protein
MISPEEEIKMMESTDKWPSYPFLPVKNYGKRKEPLGFPLLGVMIDPKLCPPRFTPFTVFLTSFNKPDLINCDKMVFANASEAVAAGWVVD